MLFSIKPVKQQPTSLPASVMFTAAFATPHPRGVFYIYYYDAMNQICQHLIFQKLRQRGLSLHLTLLYAINRIR